MSNCIGIRREDKSVWERRVAIVPEAARDLKEKYSLEVVVQPSPIRAFGEDEFLAAGAEVSEDLSACSSHLRGQGDAQGGLPRRARRTSSSRTSTKGQPYNMPMLRRLMDLGCNLVDYEKVTDERGKRLIFFGRHAGLAGMIDTLWALGQASRSGKVSPIRSRTCAAPTSTTTSAEAEEAIRDVGDRIRDEGLPPSVVPLIVGVAGYGNVSGGAQEILDLLPVVEIDRRASGNGGGCGRLPRGCDVQDRLPRGATPSSRWTPAPLRAPGVLLTTLSCTAVVFSEYLPYLTVMVNCIYWEPRYPRLVTKDYLRALWWRGTPRLRVIGDISVDIEGAVEVTSRTTDIDNPVYVYDPLTGYTRDGVRGPRPGDHWRWTSCPASCREIPPYTSAACWSTSSRRSRPPISPHRLRSCGCRTS